MDIVNKIQAAVIDKLLNDGDLMIALNGTDVTGGVYEEEGFMPVAKKTFPRVHVGTMDDTDSGVEQGSIDDIFIKLNHYSNASSGLECGVVESLTRAVLDNSNICTDIVKCQVIQRQDGYDRGRIEEGKLWRIETIYKVKMGVLL